MKKTTLLLLSLFLIMGIAKAQTNSLPATGNVGIGTTSPTVKLEVIGDSKITGSIVVDSSVTLNDSLKVMSATALKDVTIDGNAIITGDAKVAGSLFVQDEFKLSNTYGLKYFPASGQAPPMTVFGGTSGATSPPPVPFCWPTVPPVNAFNGMIVGYNSTTQGFAGAINMGFDGANSIVEAMSSDPVTSNAALLMNWYCGRDIYMCTGTNGGVVATGKNFEIGIPVRDMNVSANIKATNQTGIYINNSFASDFLSAQTNKVDRFLTKAFQVLNTTTGSDIETFSVNGDGYTRIIKPSASTSHTSFLVGINNAGTVQNVFYVEKDGGTTIAMSPSSSNDAFNVFDLTNNTLNFRVKRNGFVWARRFEVTMNNFPDYVFKKDYKRKTLYEVENYIQENGHLENMPSAQEVEKNGADLGEIQRVNVEKTEEIFLYLVELKKEIDILKKENESLKVKVIELEKSKR